MGRSQSTILIKRIKPKNVNSWKTDLNNKNKKDEQPLSATICKKNAMLYRCTWYTSQVYWGWQYCPSYNGVWQMPIFAWRPRSPQYTQHPMKNGLVLQPNFIKLPGHQIIPAVYSSWTSQPCMQHHVTSKFSYNQPSRITANMAKLQRRPSSSMSLSNKTEDSASTNHPSKYWQWR